MWQLPTLPAAAPAELAFSLWVTSNEKATTATDVLYVEVLDATRTNVLATLAAYSHHDRVPADWTRRQGLFPGHLGRPIGDPYPSHRAGGLRGRPPFFTNP